MLNETEHNRRSNPGEPGTHEQLIIPWKILSTLITNILHVRLVLENPLSSVVCIFMVVLFVHVR